jgi:predicted alpha/beta-fold hydrolase
VFPEFEPYPALRDGHRMTVASYLLSRKWQSAAKDVEEQRLFVMDGENQVMARCHFQVDRHVAPTVVLLHGLTGSSQSGYMIGTADKAWMLGFNVLRLNTRNCGGTVHLATSLYHCGMSDDVETVIRELVAVDGLTRIHVAGFSMGGNIALRVAARTPDDIAPHLASVAVVSPSLDIDRAVSNVDRGMINLVYRQSFLRHLRGLVREKAKQFPGRFDQNILSGIRTIREFDNRITAPEFGFGDAANYYRLATALPMLGDVRVPTLIVQSEDDPLVPIEQLRTPVIEDNPNIEVLCSPHGGHCAFVGRRPAQALGVRDVDRYWAENRVLQFLSR